MSDGNKAIVFVIILGIIASIMVLPPENPLKATINGVIESVTGETGSTKTEKIKPVQQSSVPVQQAQPVQAEALRGGLPFEATTGIKQVDNLINKANGGDIKSQVALGRMYMEGDKVNADYTLAYMWFNIARANGDKNAKDEIKNLTKRMDNAQVNEAQKLASLWWDTYRR